MWPCAVMLHMAVQHVHARAGNRVANIDGIYPKFWALQYVFDHHSSTASDRLSAR